MTDNNCFVCMNIARTKRCSHCNLRAHTNCWEEYKQTQNIDPLYDQGVICPQCSRLTVSRIYRTRHRLREIIREEIKEANFQEKVRQLLSLIHTTTSTLGKKTVAIGLFEFIFRNMWFLNRHPLFRSCVYNKLLELSNAQEVWNYPRLMLHIMF